MSEVIQILEDALVSQKWESLDSLLNYVFMKSHDPIKKEDLGEIIRLANIQLKNNVPLKDFV